MSVNLVQSMESVSPTPKISMNRMAIGMTEKIAYKWKGALVTIIITISTIILIKKLMNSEQIPPNANTYLGTNILFKIPLFFLSEVIAILVPLLKKSITQRPVKK